jgi:hypothetical protein
METARIMQQLRRRIIIRLLTPQPYFNPARCKSGEYLR